VGSRRLDCCSSTLLLGATLGLIFGPCERGGPRGGMSVGSGSSSHKPRGPPRRGFVTLVVPRRVTCHHSAGARDVGCGEMRRKIQPHGLLRGARGTGFAGAARLNRTFEGVGRMAPSLGRLRSPWNSAGETWTRRSMWRGARGWCRAS
jgi:hypothetical protein